MYWYSLVPRLHPAFIAPCCWGGASEQDCFSDMVRMHALDIFVVRAL